jgi:hypothetical protein
MDNPFIGYVSDLLWPGLLGVFESTVDYLPNGDQAQLVTINVMWKEGASDEEVTPGRYSHIDVRHSDLPAPPALGDQVQNGDRIFDVVRVDAAPYYFSRVVLQETGPVL